MEAFAPVLADRMELLLDHVPRGRRGARLRPGADPGPGRRPGPHQPGVPRGVLGERGRGRRRSRSTSARPRSGRSPRSARGRGCGPALVDDHAVRRGSGGRPASAGGRPPGPAMIPGTRIALTRRTPRLARRGHRPGGGRRAGRDAFLMEASPAPAYRGDTARVVADVRRWLGRPVAGGAGHRGPRPGAAAGRDAARRGRRRPARRPATQPPEPGLVHVAHRADRATASSGRRCGWPCCPRPTWPGQRTGAGHERMPSRRRGGIDPLQLTPGDYVVHEQHGVGRYLEMTSRTVPGRDPRVPGHRVRAEQARPAAGPAVPADRPAGRGHQVRPAARRPACTGSAARTGPRPRAGRARRSGEIAAELIRLYSARMASPGHAFGAGHAVAARAGGRVPLRGDAGPARRDRRGQAGHGDGRCRWTG